MSLASEANELSEVLQEVTLGLESYNADSRKEYTTKMAERLKPLVRSFHDFITIEKSVPKAKRQLDEIHEVMHNVNGAATKGEINFVSGKTLDRYWKLSTIFQESRHRNEVL